MKLRSFFTAFVPLCSCLLPLASAGAEPLRVGAAAPSVSALADNGQLLDLTDVYSQNRYTLVYFYPKADTPGCTAQGCSLRDAYAELTEHGVAVIGVSTDTVEAQRAFKEAQNYPFTLIADTERKVISAFGVPMRTFGGNAYSARQAFLIHEGKIVWADYKASTSKQAEDVLKVLASR